MLLFDFSIYESNDMDWNVKVHWEHNNCTHKSVFKGTTRETVLNEVAEFFQPYLQEITPFQQEVCDKIPADKLARLFSTLTATFEEIL